MTDYTAIVIGAGIEGSATAYHLAKAGQKTLLLEQFPLPHSRGSSHGQSRIIRRSYKEPEFGNLMNDAYAQWRVLESETNTSLIEQTGFLLVEKSPYEEINGTVPVLKKTGTKYERLTASQTRQRFPRFNCPEGYQALYEPGGGGMRADKCLLAYQQMFSKLGGTIRDNERVLSIRPGETVRVTTDKSSYVTSHLVITAGPWTSQLTTPLGLNLPLQPIRIHVCYWKTETDAYSASKGFPTFVILDQVRQPDGVMACVYGVGNLEYPDHVKVCTHTGPNIDPELRDTPTDTWDVTALKNVVREFFPWAQPTPSIQETCIYTNTPDELFILDKHPRWNNIVIGAGFSGTGFKLAPVVGQVLTEMAMGRRPSHDLEPFRISRFRGVTSSSAKL